MARHNNGGRLRSNSITNSSNNKDTPSKIAKVLVVASTGRSKCDDKISNFLFHQRDKYGRTELHRLASGFSDGNIDHNNMRSWQNKCLARANYLLKRAITTGGGSNTLLRQMLTGQDIESGYTALHRAIYNKNIPMIMLLLRFAMNDQTSSSRVTASTNYIGLLEYSNNSNSLLQEMVAIKDHEGYTPIQLLGILYCKDLANIKQNNKTQQHYGTEVLTFGSTDHPALGQFRSKATAIFNNKHTTAAHSRIVLGRVEEFAAVYPVATPTSAVPGDDESENTSTSNTTAAINIAVAAHHTLVVTTSGHLYSFGLGKGGRLGLGDNYQHAVVLKPMQVPISSKRFVVSIAAAENHSLCTTLDGCLYAWGSNRFGQLGFSTNSNSGTLTTAATITTTPVRVAEGNLRKEFITHVAAGNRHSVALSRDGQVFCFGDNKCGQLGWATTSTANSNKVNRVMWSKAVIAIAASDRSTLVLTKPPAATTTGDGGLLVLSNTNTVYSWGNGNYARMRVNFPTTTCSSSSSSTDFPLMVCSSNTLKKKTFTTLVNPVAIACAKYHNVALTQDGKCYTWGLHEEPLAREQQQQSGAADTSTTTTNNGTTAMFKNNSNMATTTSSPQLVKGMLPANGGGKVVAVSASDHHTAVLTSAGHLYTWGVTDNGNRILGHEGIKYQPSPRRVNGVFHAVAVAAAREHTALLIGTTYPPLRNTSEHGLSSLQQLCQGKIAENLDVFNVIPVFLMAERMNSSLLAGFCYNFMKLNMDTILSVAKKNHLDTLLEEALMMGGSSGECCCDPEYLYYYEDDEEGCSTVTNNIKVSFLTAMQHRHQAMAAVTTSTTKQRNISFVASNGHDCGNTQHSCEDFLVDKAAAAARLSLKTAKLVNERFDMSNPAEVLVRYESLWKAFRTITKKLNLVLELEIAVSDNRISSSESDKQRDIKKKVIISGEQREKLARKPFLEADLSLIKPSLDEAHHRMEHFNLFGKLRKPSIDEVVASSPTMVLVDTSNKLLDTMKNDSSKMVAKEGDPLAKTTNEEAGQGAAATQTETNASLIIFQCKVCNISCPDESSLSFHMNGRKHRNWVQKLKHQEERKLAECMTSQKEIEKMITVSNERHVKHEDSSRKDDLKRGNIRLPKYNLPPPFQMASKDNTTIISDPTQSEVAKFDWAKAIPRKASASPVQKLALNPAPDLQKIKMEENRKRVAGDQTKVTSSYATSPMKLDYNIISSTNKSLSKLVTLHEIMEEEERQRTKILQKKNVSPTSNLTLTCVSHSTAARSSCWSTLKTTPQPSTVNIGQLWETQCVKGNLKQNVESPSFPSTKLSPSLSLSLNSLLIKAEDKRSKDAVHATTVVSQNKTSSMTCAWKNTVATEPMNDELMPSLVKFQEKETAGRLAHHPHTMVSKKKASIVTPSWNNSSARKLSVMDERSSIIYAACESNEGCKKDEPHGIRHLVEIQEEEEDLKDTSGQVAKDSFWFVERRERAASLGEIQQRQEKEEQLFARLIEEQKSIEKQIKTEISSKKQQLQIKNKKGKPNNSRRGKQRKRLPTVYKCIEEKKLVVMNQKGNETIQGTTSIGTKLSLNSDADVECLGNTPGQSGSR